MGERYYFELGSAPHAAKELIRSVPESWMWVNGFLDAPESLISSRRAVQDSGYRLSRYHAVTSTIVGRAQPGQDKVAVPDFFRMMVTRMYPGFVDFQECGVDGTHFLPFKTARDLAAAFADMKYTGWLSFFLRDYHDYMDLHPASCRLQLGPWVGTAHLDPEAGPQPARIKLEWDERYGGKLSDIEPILNLCRELGLRQYTPGAAT